MKRIFAFFFILMALLSCKDDLTKIKKKDLLPRQVFVNILADIHLADVITNGPEFTRKYEPGDTLDLNLMVFDKYHVTRAQFDSTVAMYVRQPDVYMKVYDDVMLKLTYMLDTLRDNNPQFTNMSPQE
jgi:hypothetical protein